MGLSNIAENQCFAICGQSVLIPCNAIDEFGI